MQGGQTASTHFSPMTDFGFQVPPQPTVGGQNPAQVGIDET